MLFGKVTQYCFMGHTHLPGVFTTGCDFVQPDECDYNYQLGNEKALINVGSVGQPRDEDPRACYVVLDMDYQGGPLVTYRRIEYDIEQTANKIYAEADLSDQLGDRLKHGR